MNDSNFGVWLSQAAVVIVGWIVVHKLSAARDTEKAKREMVVKSAERLDSLIDDVFKQAKEYHVSLRNKATEADLKLRLQDVMMQLTELSGICRNNDALSSCRADVAALRRSITGGHFEDEHDGPLPEGSRQLQEMAEAFMRGKRSLLKLRHVQYQAPQANLQPKQQR